MSDTSHDILKTLRQQTRPVSVSELQRLTKQVNGFKSATFFRAWKTLKDSPNIERDENNRISFTGIMPERIIEEESVKASPFFGKRKRTKVSEKVKKMPPLYHTLPGEEYDSRKSQVIQWLLQQDEVLKYVFDNVKHNLNFNPITRKWTGKDCNNE